MTRKISDIAALLIVTGALVYTLVYFDFRVDLFSTAISAGLFFGLLSCVAYFLWRKGFRTILGLTLILGTVNLIEFLPVNMTFGGGVSFTALDRGFVISIQLFSFVVLMLFAYLNRRRLKQIIRNQFYDKPLTEQELAERKERKIERFQSQFRDRSIDEITAISRSNTFDQHAVEAAKRLLSEKTADSPIDHKRM